MPPAAWMVVAFALGASPAAAALSDTEQRAAAAVDADLPAALDLLRRSVEINSGTMNFAGVKEVADLFEPRFRELGFGTRWADGSGFQRAGHLLAERDGRNGAPRVLLIGHLDTVFEPDSPFQSWETLSDSTARGPGVTDMKGGIVVMLLALGALREAGALDDLSFSVVLTGDEEKCGEPVALARKDLLEAAAGADAALGFEDGDGDPRTAVIARRGATRWTLRARGNASHSSQIFRDDVGSGAVFEMARVLAAFHDSLAGEPLLTFNPGVLLGGTTVDLDLDAGRGTAAGKLNVVAQEAVAAGDLRALTMEQRDRAKSAMEAIVAASHPGTSAEIVFDDAYPPLAPSHGNRRLLALYDGASRDLGLGQVEAVDPARAGAADISFTAGLVGAALDGIGLMGRGGHTVEETADLRTLPSQAKRAAVLLLRMAADGPGDME